MLELELERRDVIIENIRYTVDHTVSFESSRAKTA